MNLDAVLAMLLNKQVTDSGTMTVFADDGVTPLYTSTVYEDAAATILYRGEGSERRERLA